MNISHSFFLGTIQGITEFLPVSSSGHLIVFQSIFGLKINDTQILFDIILHLGTLLAIILFFFNDILVFLKNKKLLFYICVSFILTALLGLIVSKFDHLVVQVSMVAVMLMINSFILFCGHYFSLKQEKKTISLKHAVLIGLAQGVSVIPGISRSGATISTSLVAGISREEAFKYSFILAIPTMIAAFFFQIIKGNIVFNDIGILPLIVGFIASFVFGFLSLMLLKKMLYKSKWYWFGIYCLVVGCVVKIIF